MTIAFNEELYFKLRTPQAERILWNVSLIKAPKHLLPRLLLGCKMSGASFFLWSYIHFPASGTLKQEHSGHFGCPGPSKERKHPLYPWLLAISMLCHEYCS